MKGRCNAVPFIVEVLPSNSLAGDLVYWERRLRITTVLVAWTAALPAAAFDPINFNSTGRIADSNRSLHDIIETAEAYIAVVAAENGREAYFNVTLAETKVVEAENAWLANIILTTHRRGEKFALYYERLFTAMAEGTSMLDARAALGPQGRDLEHFDGPNGMMLAEAGHLTFAHAP